MHFLPATSAMIKRYIREEQSDRVHDLLDARDAVIFAGQLVRTELASALGRRVREASISQEQAGVLMRRYLAEERRDYNAIALTEQIQFTAERLLFRHALRAADAVHVANALELRVSIAEPLVFLTADRRQADAAEAEGLAVEFVG